MDDNQQHIHREPPPPYSEAIRNEGRSDTAVQLVNATEVHAPPAALVRAAQSTVLRFRLQGTQNASNSVRGLLDVVYEEKKLCCEGFTKKLLYKGGLLVYFVINFIYSVVAVSVQREHFAYHLVYLLTSLIGSVFELILLLTDLKLRFKSIRSSRVANDPQQTEGQQTEPRPAWTNATITRVESSQQNTVVELQEGVQLSYRDKAKGIFVDYVLQPFGGLLIYPTLICNLYGFINEKSWQFSNGIAGFNFLLLLYSIVMDAVFMKLYLIWLLKRLIVASYRKLDDFQLEIQEDGWRRYFIPLYSTLPFAVMQALVQWCMLSIIGVRIYVDNFTTEKGIANSDHSVPNTGDYKVAPFTWYTIFCPVYLPIASWIVYIILNKYGFYEVYSSISLRSAATADYDLPCGKKLLAFAVDPLAYVAVIPLVLPFIAFTVAAYIPDYNNSDFEEVASSAKIALQVLGCCFIFLFSLSNLQASMLFTTMIVVVVAVLVVIAVLVGAVSALILCSCPIICCAVAVQKD